MALIKIFALHEALEGRRDQISDAIHEVTTEVLQLPVEKRFHRFFALDAGDFRFPSDKSSRYTILEIALMQGRTDDTKRALIRALFHKLEANCQISPHDLEIQIVESPKVNWGFRGFVGDEVALSYRVEI